MVVVMMCEGQCCQGEAAVTHLPILEWRGASASLALAPSEYISTKGPFTNDVATLNNQW